MTKEQYPGLNDGTEVTYTEKVLTGYRWYDAHDVKPHYPFGHGLSYTQFEYGNLTISGRTVGFSVTNTGEMEGSEVAQIYIQNPESSVYNGGYFTVKQLKEFVKFKNLKANEPVST